MMTMPKPSATIGPSVLNLIGNTPMIRLNRITRNVNATVLVKCEYMNPSGSIKDRIALRMIEGAEKRGDLRPGFTIVDATTGNTGIALAFVGAVKGYKVTLYMPTGWAVKEKLSTMLAYGAKVVEVDPGPEITRDLKGKSIHGGVVELVPRKKCKEAEDSRSDVWWARQCSNPDNIAAHRETTGKEILAQTRGNVDAFVASVGTGGTLLGVSEALKEQKPGVKIIAVEPATTPLLAELSSIHKYMNRYGIPGTEGIILSQITKGKLCDELIHVSDEDAIKMANRLAKEEGIFCGISSGANVFVALEIAERMGEGKTIVTVLPDSRYRYFSAEHYVT